MCTATLVSAPREFFVPHQLVDLAARIDASGRPDKELQDVEFQRRQRNALAVHRHALGVLVERHAADGVDAPRSGAVSGFAPSSA